MKTTRFLRSVAQLTILLCTVALCLTSCYQIPPTIIDPVEDSPSTTRPTVAVSGAQLTLNILLGIHDDIIPWSTLEGYDHDMISDNAARFTVVDDYGTECALHVTVDTESGLLTEATLSYGEISESILTDSIVGLSRILRAMSEAT